MRPIVFQFEFNTFLKYPLSYFHCNLKATPFVIPQYSRMHFELQNAPADNTELNLRTNWKEFYPAVENCTMAILKLKFANRLCLNEWLKLTLFSFRFIQFTSNRKTITVLQYSSKLVAVLTVKLEDS